MALLRCASFAWLTIALCAHAQQAAGPTAPSAPAPSSASAVAAERAQRQTDNVYRFIKLFADAPRRSEPAKVDPAKARPRTDAVASITRKPDSNAAAPASGTEKSTVVSEPLAPSLVASTDASLQPPEANGTADAASAVAAAAVAVAEEEPEELRIIDLVQPVVPHRFEARSDNEKVRVAFTVEMDGKVSNVSVVSASDRQLGRPTVEAVSQWRFAPLKEVRTAQVEIGFKLD